MTLLAERRTALLSKCRSHRLPRGRRLLLTHEGIVTNLSLSVIVKKYQTIITGQYDKKRKARRETTNDVLDRMLREEYARQKQ